VSLWLNLLQIKVLYFIGTDSPALHSKSALRYAAFTGFPFQSALGRAGNAVNFPSKSYLYGGLMIDDQ